MSASGSHTAYSSYPYPNYYTQPPPNYNSAQQWNSAKQSTRSRYEGYQYQPQHTNSSSSSVSSVSLASSSNKSDTRSVYYSNRDYNRYPQQSSRYSSSSSTYSDRSSYPSTSAQCGPTPTQYNSTAVTPHYALNPVAYSTSHPYPPPPPPPPPSIPYTTQYPSTSGYNNMNNNYQRRRRISSETDSHSKKLPKKKKKPLSQILPTRKDWSVDDAKRALEVEKEFTKRHKSQSLVIKFPDLELNREIVSKFHSAIESVHFQQPSTPRFCFVTLSKGVNAEDVINDLNKVKFGDGHLTAEPKKDREDEMNIGPEDIDPRTLYVGNLAQEVTKDDIINAFPKQRRIDIGFAKKMKYTRYAFVCFRSVQDAVEAFQDTHATEMYSKSLIVRFRRLHGNVGMPGEPKPQNPSKRRESPNVEDANTNPIDMDVDSTNASEDSPFNAGIVKPEPESDDDVELYSHASYMSDSLDMAFRMHKPKVKNEIKRETGDGFSPDMSHSVSDESGNEDQDDPLPPVFYSNNHFGNHVRIKSNSSAESRTNGLSINRTVDSPLSNARTQDNSLSNIFSRYGAQDGPLSLNRTQDKPVINVPSPDTTQDSPISDVVSRNKSHDGPVSNIPQSFINKVIKKEPVEGEQWTTDMTSVKVKREMIETLLQPVEEQLHRPIVEPKRENPSPPPLKAVTNNPSPVEEQLHRPIVEPKRENPSPPPGKSVTNNGEQNRFQTGVKREHEDNDDKSDDSSSSGDEDDFNYFNSVLNQPRKLALHK